MMKKNMGTVDRIIRVVLAIIASGLYITGTVTGTVGVGMMLLGGIFLAVSFLGFCPIYALLGIKTCSTEK
jgi:hypothetical protein